MQRRSIAAMRSQLAEQVHAGALQPALDLDDLAYLIVRIVESYLYSDVIAGRSPDIERAVRRSASCSTPRPRRRAARARAKNGRGG